MSSEISSQYTRRYQRYAWFVLGVNLIVILWGAFVRATGSGAGCGGHWPLCNGDVIPLSRTAETLIEFTHRITSGIALLLTLALVPFARRFPRGERVRKAAIAAGVLIVIEALIGAGLVLFDLVGGNTSSTRAMVAALHLSNTYLLLGALTLTAVWAATERDTYRSPGRDGWLLTLVALAGMVAVGATGAITALGDTLFPAGQLASGITQGSDTTSHFLVRLRVLHPITAIVVSTYVLVGLRLHWFANELQHSRSRLRFLAALVVLQLIAGAVNIVLRAPIWMQILHLLIADLIWVAFILYVERRIYVSSTSLP